MDAKETMIDIYKEILYTNKSLVHFVKKNRLEHAKYNRNFKVIAMVIGVGIAYAALTEARYNEQNTIIKKLSKEITELKKQKGE